MMLSYGGGNDKEDRLCGVCSWGGAGVLLISRGGSADDDERGGMRLPGP